MARLPLLFLSLAAPFGGFAGMWFFTVAAEQHVIQVARELEKKKEDPVLMSATLSDATVLFDVGRDIQGIGLAVGGLAFIAAVFADRKKENA